MAVPCTCHMWTYLLRVHIPAATACTCCNCLYLLQMHTPAAYTYTCCNCMYLQHIAYTYCNCISMYLLHMHKAVHLWVLTVGWWYCSRAWPVCTAPLCSRPAKAWSSSSSTSACWRARPTLKQGIPLFFSSSSPRSCNSLRSHSSPCNGPSSCSSPRSCSSPGS